MRSLNKVLLMGHLTRDPVMKQLPSGTMLTDFGLALNHNFSTKNGEPRQETTFVDCSIYGPNAERVEKYFKKGRPIFIEGRLRLDRWEAADGQKRSKLRVVANDFNFIDSNKSVNVESNEVNKNNETFLPEEFSEEGETF